MAKVNRIVREQEIERVEEEEVVETTTASSSMEDIYTTLTEQMISLETRLSASDLAVLEISGEVSTIRSLLQRLEIRLDEERELRLKANSDTIANMDQESLALRVFDICIDKYLEYEANNFERLAQDPAIARSGMKWLVKAHRNLVNGIEHALRMG